MCKQRSWLALSSRLRHRSANFPVFGLGKRLQRLSRDVARRSSGKHELGRGFVVGKLRNQHGIIFPHRQVPAMDLSLNSLDGFSGAIEPGRTLLDPSSALLRVTNECDIVWHEPVL